MFDVQDLGPYAAQLCGAKTASKDFANAPIRGGMPYNLFAMVVHDGGL